jgi:hypothetical protein
VLAQLQQLHRSGVRISPQDLKAAGHAKLLWACYRRFGSFVNARRAARIEEPPRQVRARIPSIAAETALAQVAALAEERAGVMPTRASYPHELYRALIHHFGSLAAVSARLGILMPGSRWTRTRIVEELRRRHRRGESMSATAIRKHPDLSNAIQRHLGTHRAALDAAGLEQVHPRREPRKWTPDRLHAALETHVARGRAVTTAELRRRGLLSAAYVYFGSIGRLRARIEAYQQGRAPRIVPTRAKRSLKRTDR